MPKNEVMTTASEEQLQELRAGMPVDEGFTRNLLPRLGMFSQDIVEGKGKQMKVITEAGTFFTEKPTDEEKDGKKVWAKEELGNEIEGILLYQRKQLKYFDAPGNSFVNSSVYDSANDIIKLFQNGAEIASGTEAELKALEQFDSGETDTKGNPKSLLKDNRILYVLYNDELYQMNLGGTSMYAWMKYSRSCVAPGVITRMNSESKVNGKVSWNQMTFVKVRTVTTKEFELVKEKQKEISDAVEQEKAFYASRAAQSQKAKNELDEFDDKPKDTKALPAGKKR